MLDSPPAHPTPLWQRLCTSKVLWMPPTVSYCMPSAIERPSALDRPHTSPVHYANSHEFHGLHRNIDEIIWHGGSYERSVWLHHQHHQWEGLDQCSMGISSYNRRVAAEFLLKLARRHTRSWATTWRQPENTRLADYGWFDCLIKPTLCSRMLYAAVDGVQTIRILSDDTDVFVLLVYWTSRMRIVDNIQMEKWNGDVLDHWATRP